MSGILFSAFVSGLCVLNGSDSVATKMLQGGDNPVREKPVYYCKGTPREDLPVQYSGNGRRIKVEIECDKQRVFAHTDSANTVITIESNRLLVGEMEIYIYDEKGDVVQEFSLPKGISKQEIQLSPTLSGGVYMVSGKQEKSTVLRERLVVIRQNNK